MKFCIRKNSAFSKSFQNEYIRSHFDISEESVEEVFEGDIAIEGIEWNIGVIVGPSGTGKSSIAAELFGDSFLDLSFSEDLTVFEDLVKTSWSDLQGVTDVLNKVGFNTPKSWLKPFSVLSNGEKMRVQLAKALLSDKEIVIFDEFTSVVDRQIAKVASIAIAKAVRRSWKKFIAVACHYDFLEYIEPDWIFDTKDFTFTQGTKSPTWKDLRSNWRWETEASTSGSFSRSIII